VPEEEQEARCQAIVEALNWQGPVYRISAIGKEGTMQVCRDIMELIETRAHEEAGDEEKAREELAIKAQLEAEARERLRTFRLDQKARRLAGEDVEDWDDDFDDDDYDVEVEYVP
jgi:GTP-binding protein